MPEVPRTSALAPKPAGRSARRRELLLSVLFFAAVVLSAAGSVLRAPLSMLEERRISDDVQVGAGEWLDRAADDTRVLARVRPAFMAWHYLRVIACGVHPLPHHAITLALGVLTAFGLSRAMRDAGADLVSALLFPLLVLFSGSQGTIWFVLMSSAENVAMPPLALAAWALVRAARQPQPGRLDAVWLSLAVLAALAKESFVLVLPALLLLRVALEATWRGTSLARTAWVRKRLLTCGLAATALSLAAIGVVLRLTSQRSHGAYFVSGLAGALQPSSWWAVLRSADVWPATSLALSVLPLLGSLFVLADGTRRGLARLGLVSLLVLAWTVPQLVLYSNGMAQRYALPALVGPGALFAFGLTRLWRARRVWARLCFVVGAAWAARTVALGIAITFMSATWWTAEARSTWYALEALAREVPADRSIVVLADPATGWGFEATFAVPVYLRQLGWHGRVFLAPVEAPAAERNSLNGSLAAGVISAFSLYGRGDLDRIGGILVVNETVISGDPLRLVERDAWCERARAERTFSLSSRPPFVSMGTFKRRALVRGPASRAFPADHPLVRVAPALVEDLGVNALLKTPYGLELIQGQYVAWLGSGRQGALEGVLWATRPLNVRVNLRVDAGPSRADQRRTVLFHAGPASAGGLSADFDGRGRLAFTARLAPGANRFRVEVADAPTVSLSNGDPRALMVLLSDIRVRPAAPSSTPEP